MWKKSALFRRSRTNEASQVAGKDMIMMEKVGESVLPGSTSVEMATTVKGAMKWAQIGHDAALKLLQALLESRSLFIAGSCDCPLKLPFALCVTAPSRMGWISQPKWVWTSST